MSLSTLNLVMLQQLTVPWVNDLSAGWTKCGVRLNSAAFLDKTCALKISAFAGMLMVHPQVFPPGLYTLSA